MTDARRREVAKLLSICVGQPREIDADGSTVLTSIFKAPVSGAVSVTRMNLDGDRQSDLTVHGGIRKAVYAYPSEHYAFWRAEFPQMDLPWGAFGENFTTEGLLESTTCIGDAFRIGSAEFVVTQPRRPCYKLAIKFGRPDIIKRFLASGRSGFYLSVSKEGLVSAGEPITRIEHDEESVTVADILREDQRRAER
jgi:MOSC domain-containing protein YiiM